MRMLIVGLVFGVLSAVAQVRADECPPIDTRYLYSDDFKERFPTAQSAYYEALNLALDQTKEAMLKQLDGRWQQLFGQGFMHNPAGGATVGRMLLAKSGDVVNAIKLADALVAQDWKTSREAVGELELGVLAAVFPAAAPLIAAGKVVNAGWQSFNNQIFDANTETLYRSFRRDPRLLEHAGVEVYIDEYLFPRDPRSERLGQKRRAYVYEFAQRIGIDLGPAPTWRKNRLLRSVVNRMRNDFRGRRDYERQLDDLERLRGDLAQQIRSARQSGVLQDLTRFDSQARRCAEQIARQLLAENPQPPARRPPPPPQQQQQPQDLRGVAVKVFAWGRDDTDGSGVGWNSYYPNPSFDDDANRRGYPNARWTGQHWIAGDQLCLAVRGLEAPYVPNHTLSLGYEIHLTGATFEDGTSEKVISMYSFVGRPARTNLETCLRLRGNQDVEGPGGERPPVGPPQDALPGWSLFATDASGGLHISTDEEIKKRTRCSFEGGGVGCKPTDLVKYTVLAGPFDTEAEARQALCKGITERKSFPWGVGLKGRWQGGEWYGLWESSVTFDCGR